MSNTRTATKTATGRRLLRRQLPELVYNLRAAEPGEEAAARQAVADARERLETASFRVDDGADAARTVAQAELDRANAALAACYEPVVVRALPPAEFEALVAQHPPRDGKDEPYNPETFNPELFLACVQGDYTREEWETEIIPQLSKGEQLGLITAAVGLNGRMTDGVIPKG